MVDSKPQPREHLAGLVCEALAISDELGLHVVGIHLDAARVELGRTETLGSTCEMPRSGRHD